MFRDPDGPDGIPGNEDDDFRLAVGSPGINAGYALFVPVTGESDLDGHARVFCGTADIGAYEFGAGDFNCDQAVDLSDLGAWAPCMIDPVSFDIRNPHSDSRFSWQSTIENRQLQMGIGCEAFDFNADFDIDLADFAYLQRVLIIQ